MYLPRRALIAICVVIVLLVGASLGAAVTAFAIPVDPSIHACVANNTGSARIVQVTVNNASPISAIASQNQRKIFRKRERTMLKR